jgi:hypothetical protein
MTALTGQLAGASNVLLAAPSMGGTRETCSGLLSDDLDAPSVLFVTYTRQAPTCVSQWEDTGATSRDLGIITVGDAGGGGVDRADAVTQNVSSPSDLTGLGIQIGQVLSEWDAPVAVCFDSLTAMLQYVDFETAYEFLHAITGQFHAAGARAHFHIDPEAHDPTQVDGITSLMDARVDLGEETTVRTRDVME